MTHDDQGQSKPLDPGLQGCSWCVHMSEPETEMTVGTEVEVHVGGPHFTLGYLHLTQIPADAYPRQ